MDSFKEQIVRKIPTKNDKIQKIFIMIASVALAALCFIFPFGTQFSVIGIFLAAAALYFVSIGCIILQQNSMWSMNTFSQTEK